MLLHFTTRECALFRAKARFCAFYYKMVCFVQSKSMILCILLQLITVCFVQSKSRTFAHFTTRWCSLFRAKAGFCAFYYQCALFRAKARFCAFYYKAVSFVQSKSRVLCILLQGGVLCSEQKHDFVHFTTRRCALFKAKAGFCAFYCKTVCFVQRKSCFLCAFYYNSRWCALFRAKAGFCAFYYQTVCFVQSKSSVFVHFATRWCALFKAKAGFCAFYYKAVCFVQNKSRVLCILLQGSVLCSKQK